LKVRFPLYLKILAWFFLNILAVGLLAYFTLGIQIGAGLDAMLLGPANERLRSISELIGRDLRHASPDEWNEVLLKFSESYEVAFALFTRDGNWIAGESMELPDELKPMLKRRKMKWRRHHFEENETSPGPPRRREHRPMFFRRAGANHQYWVGIPLRLRWTSHWGHHNPRLMHGAILVMRSETLSANGLLVDTRPWVWTGVAALVLSIVFWLPFVAGITRSVGQMTRATSRIAGGEFDVTVDTRRNDELGRLGASINRMAGRLKGFVNGQRRFMGDVAHELCTPIARARMALGALEVRTPQEHRHYLADAEEEMEQMSNMVNELLSFSKASLTHHGNATRKPVALLPLTEQAIAREAADATINVSIPESLMVTAEPGLLTRAIANVIRNAVRYAGEAGPVEVAGREIGGNVMLTISDRGPGVPEDSLPRLFDPFYRPEEARTRESGGAGLGLAIVKTCVEACGGRVSARNLFPVGFAVEIVLNQSSVPRSPQSSALISSS
jgi:two-component system sensor histidine kinase CpxA